MNTTQPPSGGSIEGLVKQRIEQFWGYGSLKAPVWFVGMEEGIAKGATLADLRPWFTATQGRTTADIRFGMESFKDHMVWFMNDANIQPTWKYPIALYLYLKTGKIPTRDEVRTYQIDSLADSQRGETACLELMPLPSNTIREHAWLYSSLNVPHLGSRRAYLEHYKPTRIQQLRTLIAMHKPKLVVFYSLMYRREWEEVIGVPLTEVVEGMYTAATQQTRFCVVPQGNARGMSYARIYAFAESIHTHTKLS